MKNELNAHGDRDGEVKICPSSFADRSSSPLTLHKKWFVNLSTKHIPYEVCGLLQLGERFNLPTISCNDRVTSEFIKHIENNIHRIQKREPELAIDIRGRSVAILNSLHKNNCSSIKTDKNIKSAVLLTNKFLKNNPTLFVYSSGQR